MADGVAQRILRAFADLAVDERREPRRAIAADRMAWVPTGMVHVLAGGRVRLPGDAEAPGSRALVTRARLHRDEGLLRFGWIWVMAHTDAGPVRFPLVSMPVRVSDGWANLLPAGDAEITEIVGDRAERAALEPVEIGRGALEGSGISVDAALLARLPSLTSWAARAAATAGYQRAVVGPLPTPPVETSGTEVAIAAALYLAGPALPPVSSAATLGAWAARSLPVTAFHHTYGLAAGEHATVADAMSPLVLDPAQRRALAAARSNTLTVVSGPPGTGKSQTVAAIALDAVAHGRSVLVAAPSTAAVDALVELLDRAPGPDPVVFGSAVRRDELARRLADSSSNATSPADVRQRLTAATDGGREHARRRSAVAELLEVEATIERGEQVELHDRLVAPGLFEADADLDRADALLRRSLDTRWWRRRRARRSAAELRGIARADERSPEELAAALGAARRRRDASLAAAAGGVTIEPLWPALAEAEDAHRRAVGAWLDATTRDRSALGADERAAVAALAGALRAGRAERRRRLAELPGAALTRALPVWIGSLRDVDDLLPAEPAMFDLVVVDEASQVDQLAAATTLLRAARAVVVGDPRQLRHVSFVADADITAAVATALPDADPLLTARLDVRRVSLFDAAASTADPLVLDRHYRSAPHLIDFSARTFYDGRLAVATRHPRNEQADCIDVARVDGARDGGVNRAEVARVIELVQSAARRHVTSLGVLTPFREQADAIEEAVLAGLDREQLERLDLRVGTVHSFQGCERDEVIVSLGIAPGDPAASLRFVHDPNLFNVMVTRARRRLTVVTSEAGTAGGLTAELLAYAESPPARPTSGAATGWTATVAAEVAGGGIAVVANYPVGRGVVDVCAGEGEAAIGLECGVHPDGVDAHIDQHLGLLRAGWTMRDAFASRWSGRLPQLVVELSSATTRR